MKLRDYQTENAKKGVEILRQFKLVYYSMEVRTGKSLTALETAKLFGAKRVLFLTKKKAINSIQNDYNDFGYTFHLEVYNHEQLNNIIGEYDLVILDESHKFAAFPKPGKYAKLFKSKYSHLPIIYLSGTPTPESYSQIYHQFWLSDNSPFQEFKTFYKWAKAFVNVKLVNLGYATVNDYSDAKKDLIDKYTNHLFISYTQQQAGFNTQIKETIDFVNIEQRTLSMIKKLKKDKVLIGLNEQVIADTASKLQSKIHQLCSGTIKFESGNSKVIDYSKANYIKNKFNGTKIGIFYKFKEELNQLTEIFKNELTTDLNEFNESNKSIALQIVSGREGISLAKAKHLVFMNIDFSATSYWQARDRLTTMDRLENEIFWIFSVGGIEMSVYKAVKEKQDYTLSHFKNYIKNGF